MHPVGAEYPHRHPTTAEYTCGSHRGTALYETHVVGQEEFGDVYIEIFVRVAILSVHREFLLHFFTS